jgi:hypothetical protein
VSPLLPQNSSFRFSTGFGISYQTAVGAFGLALGYKINPSDLDVRDAGEVLDAFQAGLPVTSVQSDWIRRLHLHLAFGVAL